MFTVTAGFMKWTNPIFLYFGRVTCFKKKEEVSDQERIMVK